MNSNLSILDDTLRERFHRNMLVEGFTEHEQALLLAARVAVVGAGGLGSACLSYLVSAGVGAVTLIEPDVVSLSNLQRQILYTTSDLGASKVERAAARLRALNPACEITTHHRALTAACAEELLSGHALVIDCTDNYAVRYVMDDYCAEVQTPLLYATAQGWGGQISLFHTSRSGSYRALYPEAQAQLTEVGVLSPVVGVVGSLQALEALKYLVGLPCTVEGRLLLVDGRSLTTTLFEL